MATPTLTNVPTSIDTADTQTNWTGEGGNEPDIKVEGTNSIYGTMTADGDIISFDGANFSATGQHIRAWVQFAALAQLDFMEMFLSDGTNTAYWEIFKGAGYLGSDPDTPLYKGGWFYAIIDFSSTQNSGTKPTANVTQVGWRFQRTANPRNVTNTWLDALTYGDGYTATGGTSGDPITFSGIALVDEVDAFGIVQTYRETSYLFGAVTIGSGATATYMKVANEAVIFADAPVSSTLYKIIATGSGCTFDVTNTLFKANGLQNFAFDMSAVNTLICTGNVFIQASPLTFASGQSVTSNTFIDCGTLSTNGAVVSNGTFSNCAPVSVSDLSQIVLSTFTGDNTQAAVELTSLGTGTMSWSCAAVTGYATGSAGTFTTANDAGADAAIFVNVASGTLTINVTEDGAIPSIRTAGATVTVQQVVTLSLTNIVPGSEVRIVTQGSLVEQGGGIESIGSSVGPGAGWNEIYDSATDRYTATYQYNYGGSDTPVWITVFDLSYVAVRLDEALTNTSRAIKINQVFDRNFNNP